MDRNSNFDPSNPGLIGMGRRLSTFDGAGYTKGGTWCRRVTWVVAGQPIVRSVFCPPGVRAMILRSFGASIAPGVLIRHDVRVHWPWKLTVGQDSWIGVGAWLLNLEPITIGANVCISQEALLCTGSHRRDDPMFSFDNAPISIHDGAWVAVRATVLKGVTIGRNSVVGATALVTRDIPENSLASAPSIITSPIE